MLNRKGKLAIGAAAVLAAAGGGAAIGASQSESPGEESQAVIDDAAKHLGISPSRLSDALKQALSDRVDVAVAGGRLTKQEGDALKARIHSDDFPLLGGVSRGLGFFGHFARFDAAADYLGLTEAQLRSELEGRKSLAQVAQDQGKSVAGLVDAMLDAAKERLNNAVAAGRITQTQEKEMLAGLKGRITNFVNTTGLGDHDMRPPSFGLHRFGRPFA
jgi:hypothetical protein